MEKTEKFRMRRYTKQTATNTPRPIVDNFSECDSNVLPYSPNFRLVYRITLHISSCLTKKENGKITHIGKLCGLYAFVHLGDSLAYQVPIANTDIYKCSFPQDH